MSDTIDGESASYTPVGAKFAEPTPYFMRVTIAAEDRDDCLIGPVPRLGDVLEFVCTDSKVSEDGFVELRLKVRARP